MDSIRIDQLPDAGLTDPKDKLVLQREVLGTWTDYQTDIETYFGLFRTVVLDFTDGGPSIYSVDPDPGRLLVFIGGHMTYKPGSAPSNDEPFVQVAQSFNGAGWEAGFTANAIPQGSLMLANVDPTTSDQWFNNPNGQFDVFMNTTNFGTGGKVRVFLIFADVSPL